MSKIQELTKEVIACGEEITQLRRKVQQLEEENDHLRGLLDSIKEFVTDIESEYAKTNN